MRFINLEVTRISEEFSSIICRVRRWLLRTSVSPCQISAPCHDADYQSRRYSNACYYHPAWFIWQDVGCFRSSCHASIRQNLTNFMEQNASWKAKRSSAGQELPSFYGTQRFITIFTTARKLSISLDRSIQSMPLRTSWRSILILSSHLRLVLPSGLLSPGFHTKILYVPLPHKRYMFHTLSCFRFDHPNYICWGT